MSECTTPISSTRVPGAKWPDRRTTTAFREGMESVAARIRLVTEVQTPVLELNDAGARDVSYLSRRFPS
jgi:hypothetical protein